MLEPIRVRGAEAVALSGGAPTGVIRLRLPPRSAGMKVLIADDHDLVRETMAAFLKSEGVEEVRTASTLEEGLGCVASFGSFDLVLLDYNMPGMNGLAGLDRMLDANAGQPVAILSGSISAELAEQAIKAGAAGYVPKTLAAKSMVSAVRFMAAGEIFAPYRFLRAQSEAVQKSELTKREVDVLRGISEGKSNKEIAIDHDLQEVTVKLHVKTLSRKLCARNRTHAAMIARDRNLV